MTLLVHSINCFPLIDGSPFLLFNGYLMNPYFKFEGETKHKTILSQHIFPIGPMVFNKTYMKNIPLADSFPNIYKRMENAITTPYNCVSHYKISDTKIQERSLSNNNIGYINPKKELIMKHINLKLITPITECHNRHNQYTYNQTNKYVLNVLAGRECNNKQVPNYNNTTHNTDDFANRHYSWGDIAEQLRQRNLLRRNQNFQFSTSSSFLHEPSPNVFNSTVNDSSDQTVFNSTFNQYPNNTQMDVDNHVDMNYPCMDIDDPLCINNTNQPNPNNMANTQVLDNIAQRANSSTIATNQHINAELTADTVHRMNIQ